MNGISYTNRNAGKHDKNGNTKKPNWQYRFEGASIGGKRQFIQKSGFPTKQAAIVAGTKAFQEYNTTGTVFHDRHMSYSDCLDSWLENYVGIRCNPITLENYNNYINLYIRPALGMYSLISIRRETVQSFINGMHKKQFSRNTLVNLLGIINNSLRYARRQGWLEINPADDIDLPTTRQCTLNRKKVREPVPDDVMEKIFERFPEGHPAHLPIMLAYHCGMRLGEVFGLAWKDVDLELGCIYVRQQVQWSKLDHVYYIVPPKYDSYRRIKLDTVMLGLLKREHIRQLEGKLLYGKDYKQLYLDDRNKLNSENRGSPIDLVNTRPNGTYIQERTTQHYNHVIRTELGYNKFDFHSLRHTHATELCEEGVNIKEIQRRLGHSTMEVTSKRYLHATERMEDESIELMNAKFTKKPPVDPNPGQQVSGT